MGRFSLLPFGRKPCFLIVLKDFERKNPLQQKYQAIPGDDGHQAGGIWT